MATLPNSADTDADKSVERHWRETHGCANTFEDYTSRGELLDAEAGQTLFNSTAPKWLAEIYAPYVISSSYVVHPDFPALDRYIFELEQETVEFVSDSDRKKNTLEGISRPIITLSRRRSRDHGELSLEAPIPLIKKKLNVVESALFLLFIVILANGTISFANIISRNQWIQDVPFIEWIKNATSDWTSLVAGVVSILLEILPDFTISEDTVLLASIVLMTLTQFVFRPYQILRRRRRLVEEQLNDIIFSNAYRYARLSNWSATPAQLIEETKQSLTESSKEAFGLGDLKEPFKATFHPARAIGYHGVSMAFLSAIFYSPNFYGQGGAQQFIAFTIAILFTLQYILVTMSETRLISSALPLLKVTTGFIVIFGLFQISDDSAVRWIISILALLTIEFGALLLEATLERKTVAAFRQQIDREALSYDRTR